MNPLAADGPAARDLILTGVPRGGTTLGCRILGQCHDTVALFEPMAVSALPRDNPAAAVTAIQDYFKQARQQLLADGTATSKQRDGVVPDNSFGSDRDQYGRRQLKVVPGVIQLARPSPAFTLVIKHNAAFAALLPELSDCFEALAIVRNPLAVLASWNSVSLPVSRGRVPAGERLDASLSQRVRTAGDVLEKQLLLLEWFFQRFRSTLRPRQVLRYEDIITTQGGCLRDRAALTGGYDQHLEERNANPDYSGRAMSRAADALVERQVHWQPWYSANDVAALYERWSSAA